MQAPVCAGELVPSVPGDGMFATQAPAMRFLCEVVAYNFLSTRAPEGSSDRR